VTFLNRVESIGEDCFRNCEKLNYVELPNTLKSIGQSAFANCEELTTIKSEEGSPFKFVDGVLFGNNGKTLDLYLKKKTDTAYTIPEGVTSITDYAFHQNKFLKSVVIPDTVTSIGRGAFSGCEFLETVVIPDSVNTIGNSTFAGCASLANARIPEGIVTIGDYLFSQCNLSSIFIPDSVTSIGVSSFYGNNLVSITIPESVTSIGYNAFSENEFLTSVFYQGFRNPCFINSLVFTGQMTVCVPPDYDFPSFCGKPVTSEDDECLSFRKMFNSCFKGAFVDGQVVQQKRRNVVEWESLTSECATYVCYNDTGLMAWSECNNSVGANRMCIADKCVEDESSAPNRIVVDVELDEGIDMNEIDAKKLVEVISENSGVDSNEFSIGWETDENGKVIRVVVYVDDSGSANKIAESMKNCQRS